MTIYYKAENRKPLVQAVSEFMGVRAVYMRTPTYAYQIDYFTVTREGNLEFDDRADSEEIEKLIEFLAGKGFIAKEMLHTAPDNEDEEAAEGTKNESQSESMGLTVAVPLDKVNVGNLTGLLDAKGSLIRKALAIPATPIEVTETAVSFPWFSEVPDAETTSAYIHFISTLCEMSVNQKRVTAKEKAVENEKYVFRCFLLRLGFIGGKYKEERKILLRNLTGSSAFKNGGADHEVSK